MRLILTFLLVLIGATQAAAERLLTQPFDAASFDRSEIRFIQAALAVDGRYSGPLDGIWGAGSQRALSSYARAHGIATPSLGDVAGMARDFQDFYRRGGWQVHVSAQANISFQLPMDLLVFNFDPSSGQFSDVDHLLTVTTSIGSLADTLSRHLWLRANARDGGEIDLRVRDVFASRAVLSNSEYTAYVRSQRVGGGYATTVVQWTANREADARLIVASMTRGPQDRLEIPGKGLLQRAINRLERREARVKRNASETNLKSGARSGTGFYVNNTDIVTTLTVVQRCGALSLADGTALQPVKRGPIAGLAVLTSPVRSQYWLAIASERNVEPGARVSVALIPENGNSTVVGARVSREVRFGRAELGRILSVPPRPGRDGAPVLANGGLLVGIAVAPPQELRGIGALFAPAQRVANMLKRERILFDDNTADDTRNAGSVSTGDDAARAVVPLFCK